MRSAQADARVVDERDRVCGSTLERIVDNNCRDATCHSEFVARLPMFGVFESRPPLARGERLFCKYVGRR
jgi:hypothetical protein